MAIEIVDLPIKKVIFHGYVSLPEGKMIQPTSFVDWVACGPLNASLQRVQPFANSVVHILPSQVRLATLR